METDLKVGDKLALFTTSRDLLSKIPRIDCKRGRLITVEVTGVEKIERSGARRSWRGRYAEQNGNPTPQTETEILITVKGEPRGEGFRDVPVRLCEHRWIKL